LGWEHTVLIVGVLGWLVVGAIVGFAVSKMVNLRGDDPKLGMGAAVAGAVIGGIVHSVVSGTGVSAWNTWSVLTAALGATIAVIVWHLVRSRTISHDTQTSRRSY
jgi:uncharacterized membrane protein YeaQ/YmgE (transglycosylase-associated protein family)